MGLLSTLFQRPEEEDLYDEYEENFDDYDYDSEPSPRERSWETEGAQPIHSVADMQIVLMNPKKYEEAYKIADLLRDMKLVVLNLSKTDKNEIGRILDFVAGVIYSEDGHIMRIGNGVYAIAPYFVDLVSEADDLRDLLYA